MFGRTLADSGPPVVLAERALAARVAGARVKVTVGVRVSSVVGATLANCVAETLSCHDVLSQKILLTFLTQCSQR